jgi:GNAT superfamily N-acetyltransferase
MTSERSVTEWAAVLARRDPQRRAQRQAAREAKAAARAAAEVKPEPFVDPPNPNEVQISCHLRPVTERDIEAITAIYNQEIADGYKVMDTVPVSSGNFHRIYSQCLDQKMPFVAAIGGWHCAADESYPNVMGFGLVTAVDRGISGSYETLSKPGGRLLVIVKPEYRRKKIGTALIDIILSSCSTRYLPKGGYQFVNITQDRTLMRYESNSRKWFYLEMEVMILSVENENKTRQLEEFQWIWNFLEAKFCLLLKHYDDRCFFEPLQKRWLDKLTFRHTCRALGY